MIDPHGPTEKLITADAVAATEAAALASARQMGRGDKHAADRAAVEAMRHAMSDAELSGTIVIGEGERDEAPMLYIGEQVGNPEAAVRVDIAVDPLEGTNLVASGAPNAICVLAASEPGGLMHAPDTYLRKLVVGPGAAGHVSINDPVDVTVRTLAERLGRKVSDVTVVVLDRPRHERLIAELRADRGTDQAHPRRRPHRGHQRGGVGDRCPRRDGDRGRARRASSPRRP